MNNEEQKAIEDLKLAIEQEKEELPYSKESLKNKQAILNYIEKLQKENEELKNNQLWSKATIEGLKERFIPKDKIRDKIKELEKYSNIDQFSIFTETKIEILKELLGEKTNE